MCNFFNATLYAAYAGCPQELSKAKTLALVARNDTVVRGVRVWNGTVGGGGVNGAGGRCGAKGMVGEREGWSLSNGTWRNWNQTRSGIWWKG